MSNLIYDGNANTGGTSPATVVDIEGASVTIIGLGTLVREDYAFTSWNTSSDGSGTDYIAGATIVLTAGNITLYANWTRTHATIYYHPNGTDNVTASILERHVVGEVITTPSEDSFDWAKHNFIANGWNSISEGGGIAYPSNNTFIMPNHDVRLYLQWIRISCTITFDPQIVGRDSHSYDVPISYVNYNVSLDAINTEVTKLLTHWTDHADGSGNSYFSSSLSMWSINIVNPKTEKTFYGQWADILKVIYDGNGHTSGEMPYSRNYSYTKDYPIQKLVSSSLYRKSNFMFSHWCTTADGLGVDYNASDYFTSGTTDVTLYAIWEPSFIVTFNTNFGGNVGSDEEIKLELKYSSDLQEITIDENMFSNYTKPHHKKLGWTISADNSGVIFLPGEKVKIQNTAITFYVYWIYEYQVTFNITPYYDTVHAPYFIPLVTILKHSVYLTIPTTYFIDYESTGYLTFDGTKARFVNWNTALDGSGISYAPGDKINVFAEDIILYTQWSIVPKIVFHNNIFGVPDAVTYKHNELATSYTFTTYLNTVGTKGSTTTFFTNWNTAADGSGTSYFEGDVLVITDDTVIIYAQWVNGRSLTLHENFYLNEAISDPFYNTITSGILGSSDNIQIGVDFIISESLRGTLTNTKYEITAWCTTADGTGTTYNINDALLVQNSTDHPEEYVLYAQWTYKPAVYYYTPSSNYNEFLFNVVYYEDTFKYGYYLRSSPENTYVGSYDTAWEALLASWHADPPIFNVPNTTFYGCWYHDYDPAYPTDKTKAKFTTSLHTSQIVATVEWLVNVKRVPPYSRGLPGTIAIVATDKINDTATMTMNNATFIDWSESGENNFVVHAGGSEIIRNNYDKLLYAHFKYTSSVAFRTTGSTGGTAPPSKEYAIGDVVTIPDCTLVKQFHSLTGWMIVLDIANRTIYDDIVLHVGDTFIMPERSNSSVTFEPVWFAIPMLRYVSLNNAMVLPEASAHLEATTVTINYLGQHINSQTNRQFTNWSTDSSNEGLSYVKGDTFIMPSTDVTLYAIWKHLLQISFVYASDIIDTVSVIEDTVIRLPTKLQTLNNKQFLYWSSNPSDIGDRFTADQVYTATMIGNHTFYAIWKPLDQVATNSFYTVYVKPK